MFGDSSSANVFNVSAVAPALNNDPLIFGLNNSGPSSPTRYGFPFDIFPPVFLAVTSPPSVAS